MSSTVTHCLIMYSIVMSQNNVNNVNSNVIQYCYIFCKYDDCIDVLITNICMFQDEDSLQVNFYLQIWDFKFCGTEAFNFMVLNFALSYNN